MKATRAQKFDAISTFFVEYGDDDNFDYDLTLDDIMQFLDKEKEKAECKSKSKSKETGDMKVDFRVCKKKTTYIDSNELGIDTNLLHKCLESPEVDEPAMMDNITSIIYYLNEKCVKKNEEVLDIAGIYLKEQGK